MFLALLLAGAPSLQAQNGIDGAATQGRGRANGAQTRLAPLPSGLPSPDDIVKQSDASLRAAAAGCDIKDAGLAAECVKAQTENYRYVVAALQHRRASFDWSLRASEIMFGVVLILVFSGLVFAAIQFRAAAPEPTQLEISASGLKVSSSVLGVVILAISMGFFYLYSRYVYPIQEVYHDNTTEAPQRNSP